MGQERIGDRIRAERQARGWTQEVLAQRSGLSWGFVRQLETHRRPKPSAETLQALANALGITVDRLMNGPEEGRDEMSAPPPLDLLRISGAGQAELDTLARRWPHWGARKRAEYLKLLRESVELVEQNARLRALLAEAQGEADEEADIVADVPPGSPRPGKPQLAS